MKLYLVSRTDLCGYDEYDSFVVAAESEINALKWHPNGQKKEDISEYMEGDITSPYFYYGWTKNLYVQVEYIGESNSLVEKVIISSFNAG